jgi:hypothetical protein
MKAVVPGYSRGQLLGSFNFIHSGMLQVKEFA